MNDAEVMSVRLVRCPKCQKLLPEPSNCLIYRCGGCDAVLRAKKKVPSVNAGLPSDDPKESEKRYVKDEHLDHVSDTAEPKHVLGLNTSEKDLLGREHDSRRSTSFNHEMGDDKRAEFEIKSNGRSTEYWGGEETRIGNDSKDRQPSMAKSDRSESVDSSSQRDLLETPSRMNSNPDLTALRNDAAQLEFVRQWISRNYGGSAGCGGVSSHAHEDEGPLPFPAYQHRPFRRYANLDGSSRGSPMGADHAELLIKLEQLKMEISRLYEVPNKIGNILFPEDRTMYNSLPRPFAQSSPGEHLYSKNHFGQYPYTPGSGRNMQDIYGYPGYLPNYPTGYQDRVKPSTRKPSYPYAHKSVMGSPITEGMEFGEDVFTIHAHGRFPHPPMCSCLSCSQKYHPQFRSPVHQNKFGNGGIPKSPATSDFYHQIDSVPIWPPHGIASVASNPAQSYHSSLPGSWPNDVPSDMDNLCSWRNSLPVHQGCKKYCHPLAGGAPFTICPKCSELLKLPKVFKVKRLSMHTMQCGSCFNVFQVDLGNRKLDTFIARKFPLAYDAISDGVVNLRNESPNRCSIGDETTHGESNIVKAFPATADHNLQFQQENSQHDERSESRKRSARMGQRSESFTTVSSEDPMLSNFVLRGRILWDVYKHEIPTEHKELNASVDLRSKSSSASSVSSQEQHVPNDAISGRILEEKSLRNDHKENKELNSHGRIFAVHSVSSEEQYSSDEMIVTGIPEEEASPTHQTGKELNGQMDRNCQNFTASSVSSEERNLSNHMTVERILHGECQRHYPTENRDLSGSLGKKSKSVSGSSNMSEATHEVMITGLGVSDAAEQPPADAFSPATPGFDTVQQLPESFTKIGPSQSSTEIEIAEIDAESSQKENTVIEIVAEPEVDFSFIRCRSSNEFTDSRHSSDKNSRMNVGKWSKSWSKSSMASFIRKSLDDFSRYQQNEDNGTMKVTINGHPITKQDLKRAEMLAGRVLPGHYWYDYYGGFWGVMGGPCLGIISPFIEEFNYPLQANCGAGNTDVFVNGRELHQHDLELLATRGLPTARHKSYKVDICGTVNDERTGRELQSLGLLAPSVIKAKRGFGMGVPAKYECSVNHG